MDFIKSLSKPIIMEPKFITKSLHFMEKTIMIIIIKFEVNELNYSKLNLNLRKLQGCCR